MDCKLKIHGGIISLVALRVIRQRQNHTRWDIYTWLLYLVCSCYERVWCPWEGDYVTCASSPCTASLMLDRDLTEVTWRSSCPTPWRTSAIHLATGECTHSGWHYGCRQLNRFVHYHLPNVFIAQQWPQFQSCVGWLPVYSTVSTMDKTTQEHDQHGSCSHCINAQMGNEMHLAIIRGAMCHSVLPTSLPAQY